MEDASRYPLSLFHLEASFILYRDRNNKTIMSMKKEERLVIEVNNLVNAMETIRQLTTFLLKLRKAKSTAFWGQTELVNLRL